MSVKAIFACFGNVASLFGSFGQFLGPSNKLLVLLDFERGVDIFVILSRTGCLSTNPSGVCGCPVNFFVKDLERGFELVFPGFVERSSGISNSFGLLSGRFCFDGFLSTTFNGLGSFSTNSEGLLVVKDFSGICELVKTFLIRILLVLGSGFLDNWYSCSPSHFV